MSFSSLQSFTKYLEKIGQLKRIKIPVSTNLEITEIQSRVIAKEGPALLFENVNNENNKKFNIPVLVNLFGTVERIALGIKRKPNELRKLGEMLAFLRQPKPPEGLKEAFNMIPLIKSAIAMKPRIVEKAPCQEVVLTKDEIDLNSLPIQNCWPNEPAPLITWPIVITKGSGEDQRDKTNLSTVPHGLDFVNQLNPISFKFKTSREDDTPTGDLRYGFKAQDIIALEGDNPVIIDNENPEHLKYKGEHLVPILVNAIKELKTRIETLEG